MFRATKLAILYILKALGIFARCRKATRGGLRILCYHGVSMVDEHQFRHKLFMSPQQFRDRMTWLKNSDYSVVSLEDGLQALSTDRTGDDLAVLTIDDGFYGTYHHALPVLRDLGFPATIYVTTYYAWAETPVFNVLIDYMLWKTQTPKIDLSQLDTRLQGTFTLAEVEQRQRASNILKEFGESKLGKKDRHALALRVGQELGLDSERIERDRICGLMTSTEIRHAVDQGFDIQLHTHRHRFPVEDKAIIQQEISDNREALESVGCSGLVHFCYPSGVWNSRAFDPLRDAHIESATTCDRGLNYSSTPRLQLNRFLDGEDVSQIEFEAFMCGLYEFIDRYLLRRNAV